MKATFLLAAAAAFALAVNAQINAVDESQVTIDTQGQFEELRDLVHAQALRIAQLEAQLVDTKQRRLKSAPAPSFNDRKGVSIKSDKAWLTMGAKKDFKIVYTGSESATIYKNVKVAGELQASAIKVKSAKIAGELQADAIKVGGKSLVNLILSLRDAVVGEDGKIMKVAASCKAHLKAGGTKSGIYPVGTPSKFHKAWCDQKTNGGGWQLVLNRVQKIGDKTTNEPVTPKTPSKALSDSNWASLQGKFTEVMAYSPHDKKFTTTTVAKLANLGSCSKLGWPPASLTRSPIAQYEQSGCHGSGSDHAHWFGVTFHPGNSIPQYTEKNPSKFKYEPHQNTRISDWKNHYGIKWGKSCCSNPQLFMLVR